MTIYPYRFTVLTMAIPINDKSDEYLMDEIAKGNQASFRVLVMRYLQPGYEFAQRMVENSIDAENIVQTVFLKIWQMAPTWEPITRFKTWYYRMLIKECGTVTLHTRRRNTSTSADSICAAPLFENIKTYDLRMALQKLSRKEKIAIILYSYQEYSPIQIARILDTSLIKIEKLLYRARMRLQVALNKSMHSSQKNYHEHQ